MKELFPNKVLASLVNSAAIAAVLTSFLFIDQAIAQQSNQTRASETEPKFTASTFRRC